MMPKKVIKIMSLALVMLFVFSTVSMVFAEGANDDSIPTRFSVISCTSAGLKITGLTANCRGDLVAQYSTSLKIELTLQKYTSSGYKPVQTWTKTGTGTHLYLEKEKTVNILNSYRLKASFTAGNETHVMYVYP